MRYLTIPDIRYTKTWRNANATRLYLYMAMVAASNGGGYRYSRRWTCRELDITESAYRHALALIEGDGLIRIQRPKERPKERPSGQPDPPPHITIVSIKELYEGNDPASDPKSDPASDPKSDPIYNKNNKKKYTLTHARVKAASLVDEVAEYIHVGHEEAKVCVRAYLDEMSKRGKYWEDESDMQGHLMMWAMKRWLKVGSSHEAENLAEYRRQMHQREVEDEKPPSTEADKTEELLSWLTTAIRSESVRSLLDARARNGTLYKDGGRGRLRKILQQQPELHAELNKLLGYDIAGQLNLDM